MNVVVESRAGVYSPQDASNLATRNSGGPLEYLHRNRSRYNNTKLLCLCDVDWTRAKISEVAIKISVEFINVD
jgi:hypothetical protein